MIDANSSGKEPMRVSEGLRLARDRLRQPGKAVRITGLSGVGKTRFAQALFEAEVGEDALSSASAIYADLGEDLAPTASELVSYLIANDHSIHLVLDNCPPDVHRQLQKLVSESSASLSLLTIEYDISDDRPEETEVIHLEPCSEKTVSMLVQRRYPDLGHLNADKIAEFSGGNARIAIALASRVDADETLTNFSDEDLFQRLFSQRKGRPISSWEVPKRSRSSIRSMYPRPSSVMNSLFWAPSPALIAVYCIGAKPSCCVVSWHSNAVSGERFFRTHLPTVWRSGRWRIFLLKRSTPIS
ncbi:hypothetical protein WJ971_19445 [Achromobacter xylosoxidans]